MALKWLDDHSDEASKGVNALVAKIFKSVGNVDRLSILGMINPKPKSFNQLKKELHSHPTSLSRNLKTLQAYGLVMEHPMGYIATTLGSRMLKVATEIQEITS